VPFSTCLWKKKINVPIDLGNDLNWEYREPIREMDDTGFRESVETVHFHDSGADNSMNCINISPLKDVKVHHFFEG